MYWDVFLVVGSLMMLGIAIYACKSGENVQADDDEKPKRTLRNIVFMCAFGLGVVISVVGFVLRVLGYPGFFNS